MTEARGLEIGNPSGPEEISLMILQQCSYELAHPLHETFNHSMPPGQALKERIIYTIFRIFKSGNQSESQNCCPIALLSADSKDIENPTDVVLCNLSEFGHKQDAKHGFK